MNRKWTEQEIWSWFREHEWISGFNFVPSTPAGGVYALLQEYDHKNAFQEEFISLLDFYHMTIMPVLFNDCTVAKQFYKEPVPGPQPEPVEGFFWGNQ